MTKKKPKTFLDGYRPILDTIYRAAREGDLALMECQDAKTGKPVAVVVAVNQPGDKGGEYSMVPLARLFDGNPYTLLNPPKPEGGFMSQAEAAVF